MLKNPFWLFFFLKSQRKSWLDLSNSLHALEKNQDKNPKFRSGVVISKIITGDKSHVPIQCPNPRQLRVTTYVQTTLSPWVGSQSLSNAKESCHTQTWWNYRGNGCCWGTAQAVLGKVVDNSHHGWGFFLGKWYGQPASAFFPSMKREPTWLMPADHLHCRALQRFRRLILTKSSEDERFRKSTSERPG